MHVFPAQMGRLMLICPNPLRSARGATLSSSSAFDLDRGGDCTTETSTCKLQIVKLDTHTYQRDQPTVDYCCTGPITDLHSLIISLYWNKSVILIPRISIKGKHLVLHTGPSAACMTGGDLRLILEQPFTSMYYDRREQLSRVQDRVCEFVAIQFHAWRKPSKNVDHAGFATHSVG